MKRSDIVEKLKAGSVIFVTHRRPFIEGERTTYQLDTGETVGVRNFKALQENLAPAGDGLFDDTAQSYKWSGDAE